MCVQESVRKHGSALRSCVEDDSLLVKNNIRMLSIKIWLSTQL